VLSITAFLGRDHARARAYAPVFSEIAAVDGPLRVRSTWSRPGRAERRPRLLHGRGRQGRSTCRRVGIRWTRDGSDDVIPVELEPDSLGHYERLRVALPSAGTWQLAVTTRTTDIDATTTRFTVRIR
jgi:hypothetical protein